VPAGYAAWRKAAFWHVSIATFISKGGFAEHRSNLKVGAVRRGEQHSPETALPVLSGSAKSFRASVRIILNKNIAGHCAFERMSDVVGKEVVPVAPAAHIEMLKRIHVVFPERLVEEQMSRVAVVCKSESVLENKKSERLREDRAPVNFFVETFGELRSRQSLGQGRSLQRESEKADRWC
jgi:hypothetical protein